MGRRPRLTRCGLYAVGFLCFLMSRCRAGDVIVTASGVPASAPYAYTYKASASSHVVGSVEPLTGPLVGGTAMTIAGSKFGDNATVTFVERNRTGGLTGQRLQCAWRDASGMACSDSEIRCVS